MSDDDYLFDKTGKADPEVEQLEKLLGASRYVSPRKNRVDRMRETASGGTARRRHVAAVVAPLMSLAAAALIVVGLQKWSRPSGPTLDVQRIQGVARVDATPFIDHGRIGVGGWLETDPGGRATIELAKIGEIFVGPDSRIGVVAIAPNEQRLHLQRGVINAQVRAMPRLFVVDTPSARATDLGCAYRLEVLPDGGTLLQVTTGAVELAGEGRQAHVPAGAVCETRPKRGPGSPYFDDASDPFKSALRHVDFDASPDPGELDTLLSGARVRDTLTLWQLIWRLDVETRNRVLARVMELVPPPPGIDLASGGPAAFQRYQDHLLTKW